MEVQQNGWKKLEQCTKTGKMSYGWPRGQIQYWTRCRAFCLTSIFSTLQIWHSLWWEGNHSWKKMNITACLVFARSHVTNLKAIRRKLWSEDTNINLNVLNVWYNPNAVIPTIMLGGCFAAGWIAKQFEALWFMKWDINILEWLFWFISVLKLWYWRENVSKWKLVKPLVVKGYYMSPVKE